jgi:tol-pal system protein YbgF
MVRRFFLIFTLTLFVFQPALSGIDTDKVIMDHNKKIKRLVRANKALKGQIEQLSQQQLESNQKITELFNLMEYKKSSAIVEKTMLRVREHNKKAKNIYTSARSLLVTDQYDQAVILFKQYLDVYPESNHASDAHYWLAKTYLAQGQYSLAKNTFIAFQQNSPLHHKYANSLFELAKVYIELKQTAKAKDILDNILDKFPSHRVASLAQQLLGKITTNKPIKSETEQLN